MLCSENQDKSRCVDYIEEKLFNSGFKDTEVKFARNIAENLKREDIVCSKRNARKSPDNEKTLTYMINRNEFMVTKIKEVIAECQPDIDRLLGKTKVLVAERRNCNVASTVFAKSSFSRAADQSKVNQRCNESRCKTCEMMNLKKALTVRNNSVADKKTVKLDFKCDCTTDCVIYIYVCKICPNNDSFYVGQSVNSCRVRANGHRACFTKNLHKKSALLYHILGVCYRRQIFQI